MSIPAGCERIQLRGHLGTTEIFETGYWLNNAVLNQDDANTVAAQEVGLLTSSGLMTALTGLLSTDSGYDELRLYSYPNGGPTAEFVGAADITDGVGTLAQNGPFQVALVATMLTGRSGRSYRGRAYMPYLGLSYASASHNYGLDVTPLVTAWADFGGAHVSTQALAVVSQVGAGAITPITAFRVDNRVDIQRRRANKQLATQTVTVPVTVG